METTEIQMHLHNLDNETKQAANRLNILSDEISKLFSQADNCKVTANSLLDRATCENDANKSADMVSQASMYFSRADYYVSSAKQMEYQADGIRDELRNYKNDYEYYMNEGETNLANLEIAVSKFTKLDKAEYGKDKIRQTLEQIKHRVVFNKNLVEGCKKRISWIEQICGNAGTQPVKKFTLH